MHIAAALGLKTLGIFSPRIGINAERWGPLGAQAEVILEEHDLDGKYLDIPSSAVLSRINAWC